MELWVPKSPTRELGDDTDDGFWRCFREQSPLSFTSSSYGRQDTVTTEGKCKKGSGDKSLSS